MIIKVMLTAIRISREAYLSFTSKEKWMEVKEHYKTLIKEVYKYKQNYNNIFESDWSSPAPFEH